MAISIDDNITRQNDLETSASGGNIGSGPGGALTNPSPMAYQGTGSFIRRIQSANSDHGFTISEGTARNINTGGFEVFWYKGFVKQRAALNANGMRCRLGSATTAYYVWTMADDGTIPLPGYEYPAGGGFVVAPIFVGLRAWHDVARTGSPDVTAIDVYAHTANVSITANGEDNAMDSLDWSFDGLFLTGGTPDGTFQDFLDADEGEGGGVSGRVDRIGMWQSREGIFFVFAKHVVGRDEAATTVATQFTDSFATIVFPGGKTDTGYNGFEFDLTNASTTVDLTNCSIGGQGRSTYKVYFDTELDVTGGATDTINIPNHDFTTGEQVQYSAEGGTEDIGPDATNGEGALVTGTTIPTGDRWYVIVSDANTIQLASTLVNALAGTATGLTASTAGNGEQHSLTRTPDTRPDIEFTGSGGSADITGCVFTRNNAHTLRSVVTYTSCTLAACGSMTLNSGTLDECSIESPVVGDGEAFLTMASASELANVTDCVFDGGTSTGTAGEGTNLTGRGHAIEITTTAGTVGSVGNLFNNYRADPGTAGEGWQFNTETDVTGGATDTITYTSHGFSTGEPVYYSQEGITTPENIGLTEDVLYWVRADTANTFSLFLSREGAETNTNRISLTASTAGNGETHAFYSAHAALHNSTGGTVTINVSGGGASPSVRNSNGSTTIVQATVTLQVTIQDANAVAIPYAKVRIENASTGALITDGFANNLGVFTDSGYNYTGDVSVNIIVRKNSPGDTRYLPVTQPATIVSTGLSATISMTEDTNAGKVPMRGILKTGVVFEFVTDATLPMTITLPAGTSRKLVCGFLYWDSTTNLTVSSATYDGNAMTNIAGGSVAEQEGAGNFHEIALYRYDIPDTDSGDKVVSVTWSASVTVKAIAFAIIDDVATGAENNAANQTGDTVTTNPSVSLNNSAEAWSVVFLMTDDTDSPSPTGVASLRRSDQVAESPPGFDGQMVAVLTADRTTTGAHSMGADYGSNSKTWVAGGATFLKN